MLIGASTAIDQTLPTWVIVVVAVSGNTLVLRTLDWWLKRKRADAEAHRSDAQADQIAVKTATDLVSGVRRELDTVRRELAEARERVAALESVLEERGQRHAQELENIQTRHNLEVRERDDVLHKMRRKVVTQGNELVELRAMIAERPLERRDDPEPEDLPH